MQQALAAAIEAPLHLWQQRRASDHGACLGLTYAGRGSGEVMGVVLRALDQLVQLAAGERLPPVPRWQCDGGRSCLALPVLRCADAA
ncbi:hypothetical protein D3C79_873260 [compost metagenome]